MLERERALSAVLLVEERAEGARLDDDDGIDKEPGMKDKDVEGRSFDARIRDVNGEARGRTNRNSLRSMTELAITRGRRMCVFVLKARFVARRLTPWHGTISKG